MSPDEMIAVIQAYKEGKRIEYKYKTDEKWRESFVPPVWAFNEYDYRVSREPRKCLINWNITIEGGPSCLYYDNIDDVKKRINEGWQLVVEDLTLNNNK